MSSVGKPMTAMTPRSRWRRSSVSRADSALAVNEQGTKPQQRQETYEPSHFDLSSSTGSIASTQTAFILEHFQIPRGRQTIVADRSADRSLTAQYDRRSDRRLS